MQSTDEISICPASQAGRIFRKKSCCRWAWPIAIRGLWPLRSLRLRLWSLRRLRSLWLLRGI